MGTEVENLLREKQIYFTSSGNDYLTKCMNPEHEDSNPSFRIDRVKGIGHCFSCGFSINIFKHFGVIVNMTNMRIAGLKDKIKILKQGTEGLDMLDGYTPVSEKFRGISTATMRKFDMFYTEKIKGMEDRIIVPLKDIKGRIKVFVGRHVLSNTNPRYMIYPKECTMSLFPPILATKSRALVLVEGIFDMLNMYDKGLHCVSSTMGTNTINNEGAKHKLLPFKAQGVTHIFICYDGDEAGVKAAAELKPRLEAYGFVVEIIPMADGTDPGDLSQQDVLSMLSYITEISTGVSQVKEV